jgi:hypothetical protein
MNPRPRKPNLRYTVASEESKHQDFFNVRGSVHESEDQVLQTFYVIATMSYFLFIKVPIFFVVTVPLTIYNYIVLFSWHHTGHGSTTIERPQHTGAVAPELSSEKSQGVVRGTGMWEPKTAEELEREMIDLSQQPLVQYPPRPLKDVVPWDLIDHKPTIKFPEFLGTADD